MTVDLEALRHQVTHGYIDIHGGDGSDEEAAILALIEVVEAARPALEALDDAIVHNVNATAADSAGWTQADYDEWDNARTRLSEALAPFNAA